MKKRADVLVVEQGLAPSREKAKALIMAGQVFHKTQRIDKPGEQLSKDIKLQIKGGGLKYVSRGGYKLEKMIEKHKINLEGKICCDIGSSTGGFTDCMLQNGAKKVYAIDVGYNQLDYQLRIDPRVVVMERTNARTLNPQSIKDPIDFITIDVSFISLELILPVAKKILESNGKICALIKPQFEAGREKVGKKGIVRDPKVHQEVLEKIINLVYKEDLNFIDLTYSPIKGATGNIEFLMLITPIQTGIEVEKTLDKLIETSQKDL